jgi:hypothetical protein
MALYAPSEKVETFADVADPGFLLRQAEAHRCEYTPDFAPQRFRIESLTVDENHKIIRSIWVVYTTVLCRRW